MYPPTRDQRRTWFLHELHPANPVFTVAELVTVTGPLSQERMRAAVAALTSRHDALRTSFSSQNNQLRATVLDAVEPPVSFEEGTGDVAEWARAAARKPFDAASHPLFRLRVRSTGPNEHALLFCADRLIADEAALPTILRELGQLYAAEVTGRPVDLPAERGYAEVARAEHVRLADPAAAHRLEARVAELSGLPGGIELPADRLRPPRLSFAGDRLTRHLPRSVAADLAACAAAHRAGPEHVLLAALATLVARYAGVAEVLLAVPHSSAAVGPSEVGVLRVNLGDDPPFTSVIGRVAAAMSDPTGREFPFALLVERLTADRDLSLRPLCQLAFAMRPTLSWDLPDARVDRHLLGNGTSLYDMSWSVSIDDAVLAVDYDADLFAPGTVDRMVTSYLTLLTGALTEPATSVGALPLLDRAESCRILDLSVGTERDIGHDVMVHEQITAQAKRRPDAVALTAGSERLGYRELNRRANEIANHLHATGCGLQTPIGICLPRSIEMVVAVLGVLKAGNAPVLLDPVHPTRRLAAMLDDSRAPFVLTSAALLPGLPDGYGGTVCCLDRDEELIARAGDSEPPAWSHPAALCQIAYTSGSTGEPRGIAFQHGPVRQVAFATQQSYSLTEQDQGSWVSAPGFGISFVNELWPFLTIGATVHIADEQTTSSPFRLRDWLVERGVTVSVLAKALAERVCAADWPADAALRVLMVSGERSGWLPATVPFEIVTIYGSTETTNATSCLDDAAGWRHTPRSIPPDQRRSATAPVGRPVTNARVYLLDDRLQLVPIGVTGAVHVGGRLIQGGYLNRAAATAGKWLPDPYAGCPGARMVATGDLGRRLPDGAIEILGRSDEQISLNGYRIELGEVTARLSAHPSVRQAAVIVAEPASEGRRLIGYVVPEPNRRPTSSDLREMLGEELPAYMVPSAFVMIEALPMLPNRKVDSRALPRPGLAPDEAREQVEPSDATQRRLADIWCSVLHRERVGIRDNYFEIGGDSLTGMELMAAVTTAFGVTLPLRVLFEAPTIEQMAAAVVLAGLPNATDAGSAATMPAIPLAPQDRHEPFPLTDIQYAYWIGRTGGLELGEIGCHGYQEWDVAELDLERLEKAVDRLVQRHDMLRAIVTTDGNQRVLAEVDPYPVPVTDLRKLSRADQELRLAELRETFSHEVLPADRWPLFQVRATLIDETTTRIHVSFDLLIFDARSARIFTQELGQLYRDPDLALPDLELSFRDYAVAERAAQRDSPAYRASLEYWRGRLDELPPAPELPYERSLSAVQDPRFARHAGRLAPLAWRALRQGAARAGITPSTLLLAAYAEVLAIWSAGPRFTLNLTLFHRPPLHPQLNDILGDFTSGLLLVVQRSEESFTERARRIQAQLWQDLEHRSVSSVTVIRELARRQGGAGPRAAMPVVFSSLVGVPRMEWGNLGSYVYGLTQTPQVALDHQVMEVDGGLDYAWDAVAELFPDGLIAAMVDAYHGLLQALATDSAAWQRAHPVGPPAEQLAVRESVNATTESVPDEPLHAPLLRQFAERPDSPAVVDGDLVLSYRRLDEVSAGLARRLAALGDVRGHLVGVLMGKGWEQVAAVLGILRAGAAYLPIDPALPLERIRYLIDNGRVRALLVQPTESVATPPPGVDVITVTAGRHGPPAADGARLPMPPGPEDLAYVIYTSGSTGEPKGVMIDHRAALNTVLDINRRFRVGPADRVLAVSSLSFDLSVWDIFGVLGAGGTLVMPPAADNPEPAAWADLVARYGVTIWNSAPALLQILIEYLTGRGERLPDSLRMVMLSGDWIALGTYQQLRTVAPRARLISLGGATEAAIWSIFHEVGPPEPSWNSVPYGRPLANQRWHVLDDMLQPRPDWVTGGLFIAGTGLARGYWRDEAKTAARFFLHPRSGDRLYRTGDLGRYRPGGELEILGREDFQVKILGQRIELGEIEAALGAHPQVAACCVVAVGQRAALRLVAHVVPEPGSRPADDELRRHLANKLPAELVPARYVMHSALPLTGNGKLDRAALIALGEPAPDRSDGAVNREPASPTEALLLQAMGRVLGTEQLGPTDNFFAVGGDSLRAIGVINEVAVAGVDIPVALFFRHPTARDLAHRVQPNWRDQPGAGSSDFTIIDLRDDAR
ncbi:MAG TPA: amino acid adenylation domain-containing protein [Jatrophihabitans sp.]|nr:amino acid adenylation domain-containing protein [Jatrophihabitans sp.]